MTLPSRLRFVGFAAGLAAIQLPTAGIAESRDTAIGSAQAEVVEPIRAVPLAELSFGSVAVSKGAEGSVRIAADGSQAQYMNAARLSCDGSAACAPHRAMFEVRGGAGRAYRVTMPAYVIAYGARTGFGLNVTDLIMQSRNSPGTREGGLLNERGRDTFYVGGTLQVPAGTRPDHFRADLPILVSYN